MNTLQAFDKDFIINLFLDTDSVSTVNRMVVSVANLINENNDNICTLNQILHKEMGYEYDTTAEDIESQSTQPPKKKTKHFYETIISKFSDTEFEEHFKMKKSTVNALIAHLRDNIDPSKNVASLDKKVHIFLWLLTSDSSYAEMASLFNIRQSSVASIFHEIATLITEHQYDFVIWPSLEEQHLTRIKVHSRLKIPNCIGFIDACRLKIRTYKNKKESTTILLQAVCDNSLFFTDIHVGQLGKSKKSKVFKDSALSQELQNFIEYENHILGDSEYKLKMNLITPFSREELLTSEEMKFNEVHWKARAYIGRAFELLKERFRKLNHIDISKMDTVTAMIKAACVLHNFILLHEGLKESDLIKEEIVACEEGVDIDMNVVTTAAEKRQFLCNYVNYIDNT